MLYCITLPDESVVYITTEEEYNDLVKALDYMGLEYKAHIVQEKMYCIHWYDYIDEIWATIWATEDTFAQHMADIKEAQVEHHIEVFN